MKFDELDIISLDKGLSEEEKTEWNSIYASYRAGSLLTGRIVGVDDISFNFFNAETKRDENKTVKCLVVIPYRVKIIIPDIEVWYDENSKRPDHVLRSMVGAEIDFVITDIDRKAGCCIASRRRAMFLRRRNLLKLPPKTGQKIECNIIAVGKTKLLCSYGGFDVSLQPREISYAMIPDLRERFHTGETKEAIVKGFAEGMNGLFISIKEAQPHPFDGIELRHPIGCRRSSVITCKYKGGVFCRLEDNLNCLCTYSPYQYDEDFYVGDNVIVAVTKYNYEKKTVYGKIVAKW